MGCRNTTSEDPERGLYVYDPWCDKLRNGGSAISHEPMQVRRIRDADTGSVDHCERQWLWMQMEDTQSA